MVGEESRCRDHREVSLRVSRQRLVAVDGVRGGFPEREGDRMAARPRIIWCADGNAAHSRAALAAGWLYGVRLPTGSMLTDVPLTFADQNWRKPDRARYFAALARHRPALATCLDWERPEQFDEVLSWAEEAASLVTEAVLVIPKVSGMLDRIPTRINGRDDWLAYSVPTSYGGSPIFLAELAGWPVHLLGGSPQRQLDLYRYLRGICDVRSIDNNMVKKMATSRCCYWSRLGRAEQRWTPLDGFDGNGPTECVRRSCANVSEAWDEWSARR